MGKTGTKKLAKGLKAKTAAQFCIDGYLVKEVLDGLPTGITILGAKILIGAVHQRRKIIVPTVMKKMGVQKLEESVVSQQATLVFDQTTKPTIKSMVKAVSAKMGVDPDAAFFKYITVKNGEAVGKFEHCTKEIKPDERDLRKKLRVLGLTDGEGKINTLIRDLSAKKYECQIKMEEVRTIVCSQMK